MFYPNKNNKKPTSKRLIKPAISVCGLVLSIVTLSSCSSISVNRSGYKVVSQADLGTGDALQFSQTILNLQENDTSIVVAEITKLQEGAVTFKAKEIIAGFLGEKEYSADFEPFSFGLEEGETYILFVKGYNDKTLTLVKDSSGWLQYDERSGDVKTQIGKTTSIETIRFEIDKATRDIILPSEFLFYRDLEDLIDASDTVVIGKLQSISERDLYYYLNNEQTGVRQSSSSKTDILQIKVDTILKGDTTIDNIQVYDAEIMQRMVRDAYTNEIKSINGDKDLQKKYQSTEYIFFLVDTQIKDAPYAFFTNPIQGLVPIDSSGNTHSIFNNPAFLYSVALEDIITDIRYTVISSNDLEVRPDNDFQ